MAGGVYVWLAVGPAAQADSKPMQIEQINPKRFMRKPALTTFKV
jgi:hypothetical protein